MPCQVMVLRLYGADYRGVQVDDDGERDVGHGQRYYQVEEEERRH